MSFQSRQEGLAKLNGKNKTNRHQRILTSQSEEKEAREIRQQLRGFSTRFDRDLAVQ